LGKKSLILLKETLLQIKIINDETIKLNSQIEKLSEQKKNISKEIRATNKKMKVEPKISLSSSEMNSRKILNRLKKSELQDLCEEFSIRYEKKQYKDELISLIMKNHRFPYSQTSDKSVEELKIMLKDVEENSQIKEKRKNLRNFNANNPSPEIGHPVQIMIGFLAVILAVFALKIGNQTDIRLLTDYQDRGFDCKNGETIHGSLVLNGDRDCSNGHDEDDPFFATSDAQDYEMGEPWGIRWILYPLTVLFFGLLVITVNHDLIQGEHNKKKRNFLGPVESAEGEVGEIKKKYILACLESDIQIKIGKKRDLLARELNKKSERLSRKLKKHSSEIISLEPKLTQLNIKKTELYGDISHLIPYSNFL